jgi:hypothetical protein
VRRVRRDRRVIAGVGKVRLRGEAAQLVEHRGVETVSEPVGQAVLALVADVEQDALFGHLARRTNCVTQLVDDERVRIGGQRLFVALQRAVAGNAATNKLTTQAIGDTITAALGQIIDLLDDAGGRRAEKIGEEGLAKGLRPPAFCATGAAPADAPQDNSYQPFWPPGMGKVSPPRACD